ncbi:peptidoglycan editing factor PgeF [Microlunatus sp. Y2014]|uniref:peptidoglycan editing factor PgeF n=1 Tax=Microlunatus sp. Y2014 TaxID=3418488 RepID=UPI003DA766EE
MFHHRTDLAGLGFAFTDRHGGVSLPPYDSLNLGRTDLDDPDAVGTNLQRVRAELGLAELPSGGPVVTLAQIHSADVVEIDRSRLTDWDDRSPLGSSGGRPPLVRADAMVTTLPQVALTIRVADCLPVVLADRRAGVLGVAHAGRRGLVDGILPRTVERMRALGASDITAWIGPSICGACYEVPPEMAAEVSAVVPGSASTTSQGTTGLDLAAGAVRQLADAGCPAEVVGGCTAEDRSLYSHRRDGPATGRLAGIAWLT